MSKMRAKMRVSMVTETGQSEALSFTAVGKNGAYPEDGSDENNTFAKFTPQAFVEMVVNNPDLTGTFEEGQEYYVDFTLAE